MKFLAFLIGVIVNTGIDTFWTKTFGTSGFDEGYGIAVDDSNFYIVVGRVGGEAVDSSGIWILKLNPTNGDTIWTRIYDLPYWEDAQDIAIDSSGNYLVIGKSYNSNTYQSKLWLLKILSQTGDTLWTKTYLIGGSAYDKGIVIGTDGYYYVLGNTNSSLTGTDVVLLKIDPSTGDTLWTRTYGGDGTDLGEAIACDREGYIVIAGITNSFDTIYQAWLLKIDPVDGDTIWTLVFNTTEESGFNALIIDSSNYYVPVGYRMAYGSAANFWIMKLNPENGTYVWINEFGGTGYQYPYGATLDRNGYYIIAGRSGVSLLFDMAFIKVDPVSGDSIWGGLIDRNAYDEAQDIAVDNENALIAVGGTGDLDDRNLLVVKFANETGIEETGRKNRIHYRVQMEANNVLKITVEGEIRILKAFIYDVLGRKIKEGKIIDARNVEFSGMKVGVYMAKLQTVKGEVNVKLLIP